MRVRRRSAARAVAIAATAATGASAVAVPEPAAAPAEVGAVEVVRLTGWPDLSVPPWSGTARFADGAVVRLALDQWPGTGVVATVELTSRDGRRLGPVPIDASPVAGAVRVRRVNLDEDPDLELVIERGLVANGSVFPSLVEILDPLGPADARSRPLAVHAITCLDPSPSHVRDLDGDGRPEILFGDLVTADPSQCTDGREHRFVAWRPHRLRSGGLRDASADLPGWPRLVRFTGIATAPGAATPDEGDVLRADARADVLATARFEPRSPADDAEAGPRPSAPTPSLAEVFGRLGVRGSIVVLPQSACPRAGTIEHDAAANDRRSPPGASFDPVHALLALRFGAIAGLDEPAAGEAAGETVRDALQSPAAGVFRRLAARLDRAAYADGLASIGYGDGPPRDAETDDRPFWEDGGLLVSPREQAEALRRLAPPPGWSGPLDRLAPIRSAMPAIRGDGWVLRGATGRARDADGSELMWFAGWVERRGAERVYVATRLDGAGAGGTATAASVTLACLRAAGVLPPE